MKTPPTSSTLRLITDLRGGIVKALSVEEAAAPAGTTASPQFRPHTLLVLEFGAVLLDREGQVLGALPFTAKDLLAEKERITDLEDLRDTLIEGLGQVDRAIALHKNRAVDWIGKLQGRVNLKVADSTDPDARRIAASARPFQRVQEKVSETATTKRRATIDRNSEIAELRQDVALRDLRLKSQGGDKISVEDVAQLTAAKKRGRKGRR